MDAMRGPVHVRRWDGERWIELGDSISAGLNAGGHSARKPSVAVDREGRPVVAWHEFAGAGTNVEIFVKRWNGTAWLPFGWSASPGGISRSSGRSWDAALDLDPAGNPVVAWRDDTAGNFETWLRRWWINSAWVEVGRSAYEGGVSATRWHTVDLALRLDAAGRPVLAWIDEASGTSFVHLRAWDGKSWAELAGSATGSGISVGGHGARHVTLDLDASGAPVVAWTDGSGDNFDIFLRKYVAGKRR
jgi:hypothetical protein